MCFSIGNEDSDENNSKFSQNIIFDPNLVETPYLIENFNSDIKKTLNFKKISKEIEKTAPLFSTDISNDFTKNLINDGKKKDIDIIDENSEKAFTQLTLYNSNPEEIKSEEIQEKINKKKSGRKRKRDLEIVEHNKYSEDNLKRKCKHLVIKNVLIFINLRIKKLYNGNIGNGVLKKEIRLLKQWQVSNSSIKFNQDFINKTIGNIFSENISGRYSDFPKNQNQLIIQRLMNEKDEEKRIYFKKLFNITFIQCLNHFIGKANISELDGLKQFKETKKEIIKMYPDDGEEYFKILDFYINNYEDLVNKKMPMLGKKSKNKFISSYV